MIHQLRHLVISVLLVSFLFVTGCSSTPQTSQLASPSMRTSGYAQIEQGNTPQGQDFGQWVTRTARGIIQDAYVRDENKLGVVITPKVEPREVKPLARSLVAGFHKNFPERDLTVLVYAPDKQLILTAKYRQSTDQIQYQSA